VAKKKPRTPPPPRPVQAPRAGTTSTKGPRDPRKTRLMFLGLIAVIVVIALAAVLGIALAGGDDEGGGAEATAGGCTTETFPEQGREHVEELPAGYEYNSFPPTSGSHNPVPAIYNVYPEPVDQMLLVHNLEHGAVVVQYGDQVPQAEIDSIVAWYSEDPNGLIVAPLPELGGEIAVTAWTHLMKCPAFSEEAFDEFTEDHRFQGPERFSPDAMQPGTN
jgi:Protein of unknown function (DUF3105)